jgi:integrase
MPSEYRSRATTDPLFPVQVLDGAGLPHAELSLVLSRLPDYVSNSTAKKYGAAILRFFDFVSSSATVAAHEQDLDPFGTTAQVRMLVRLYLTEQLKVKVQVRRDDIGSNVNWVHVKHIASDAAETVLNGLRKVYDILSDAGLRAGPNPLMAEDAGDRADEGRRQQILQFRNRCGRNPMPDRSGVDCQQPHHIRYARTYFRVVGGQWKPHYIDDPRLIDRILNAGKSAGWPRAVQLITEVAAEAGCRISEVLAITVGDWYEASQFGQKVNAIDKGSRNRRRKVITITPGLVKAISRYFDQERRAASFTRQTLAQVRRLAFLGKAEILAQPLFLNSHGGTFSYSAFNDHHFRPAMKAARLAVQPHSLRHHFVNTALNEIEAADMTSAEKDRRKESLVEYMAWRTGEKMLGVYGKVHKERRAHDFAVHFQRERHRQRRRLVAMEKAAAKTEDATRTPQGTTASPRPSPSHDKINKLFEDDVCLTLPDGPGSNCRWSGRQHTTASPTDRSGDS